MTASSLWTKRLSGILRFLESAKGSKAIRESGWGQGTIAYWKGEAEKMIAAPPPGCRYKAQKFRNRLKKV